MLLHSAGSSLNRTQLSLALLLQKTLSVGGVLVFPLPYLISLLVQYQDTQGVRFEYYDNRDDGKRKEMVLEGVGFIRRYLDHVLPKGFQRVRHYGLHHSSRRKKIEIARGVLGGESGQPEIRRLKLEQWLGEILGEEEPFRCPYCGKGLMVKVREFSPIETWRLKFAPIVGKLYQWGWGY